MSSFVGATIGQQFTGAEMLQGKCPSPGNTAVVHDSAGRKEYLLCLVAASQNLVNGHLVSIAPGTFTVTVVAAGNPAPTDQSILGVVRTSVTASASSYVWVQRFGVGSVLASASTLPNINLGLSAAAGTVDDAVATASGIIDGLILTATTAASGITACFLTYPHFAPPGAPG